MSDGWHYRVWQGVSGRFVAECKRTPFEGLAGHGASMLLETGDIWFEFGATEEEALRNLKASDRDDGMTVANPTRAGLG